MNAIASTCCIFCPVHTGCLREIFKKLFMFFCVAFDTRGAAGKQAFLKKYFFLLQKPYRIILGHPKHVLHLVCSVLGISTAIITALWLLWWSPLCMNTKLPKRAMLGNPKLGCCQKHKVCKLNCLQLCIYVYYVFIYIVYLCILCTYVYICVTCNFKKHEARRTEKQWTFINNSESDPIFYMP